MTIVRIFHPVGIVLTYLMTRDCAPKIVTEIGSTVYMQRIVRDVKC